METDIDILNEGKQRVFIQYIVIKLGEERYGINIKYIDNIVRLPQITRVPKVEDFIRGVINIRGEIVPVISLRLIMDMENDQITDKSRIIIIRNESEDLIGCIVDEVHQVLTLDQEEIEKVQPKRDSRKPSFITGVGQYEEGLVSILDLATVELDNLDRMSDKEA